MIRVASAILLVFITGLSAPAIISALTIIFSPAFIISKLPKRQKFLETIISHLQQRLQNLTYRKRNLDESNVSKVPKWYKELKIYEDAINELEEKIRNLADLKSQQESLEREIARIESELDHLKPHVTKYIQAQSILKREELKKGSGA
ncbi:hypothetical protein J7L00_07745 [Candidatus Bathyarchaeota archaeon]|nr:hypothetical protein [Candidatus Bathyarchaeota archaeon]